MLKFDEEAIAWTCNGLFKILDIKFSKSPKNIKESDGPLLGIIEKKKYIYIYMTKQ